MQEFEVFQVQSGWTAYDVLGESIGHAIEVGSTYVLVETNALLPANVYVPLSRVNSVDESEAHFSVNVPKDEIDAMGWQNPPADGSWDRTDTAESLAIPVREERSDAVRGYVDVDEARR